MKAIIIAAGRGIRLAPHTDAVPKSMLAIAGVPILHRAAEILRRAGIDDLVVIRGYAAQNLECPGARYVDHPGWHSTNVLGSLFSAKHEIKGELIIIYSDIVFTDKVVQCAMGVAGDIVAVTDTEWRSTYENRRMHPVAEAEKVILGDRGIERIGKSNVVEGEADGEFVGMLKLSPDGSDRLVESYEWASAHHEGAPFGTAGIFEQAYLTDLLQFMVDQGQLLLPALIQGGWREIDTAEDLTRCGAWLETQK